MPPDGTETEYPESPLESESGGRPYGLKPYGLKPYGLKPYGLKPYGLKPYGLKPYGLKPYGLKPYGLKPYGLKPYGLKAGEGVGDAWSAEVSELVTEHSAVVRLGATIVPADDDVDVVSLAKTDSKGRLDPYVLGSEEYELVEPVRLRNRLKRKLDQLPELSEPLKVDLAQKLAGELDTRALDWRLEADVKRGTETDKLQLLRGLLEKVKDFPLRNPGWIINRATLDDLSKLRTPDTIGTDTSATSTARSFDSYGLLRRDGADGATLLGFPVITTSVKGIYFSADWDELWIGVDGHLVNVAASAESAFEADDTVIRATMSFGSLLRHPEAFATDQPKLQA
jgi:hypothetical protein